MQRWVLSGTGGGGWEAEQVATERQWDGKV